MKSVYDLEDNECWAKLALLGVKRRSFDDEFFVDGNKLCHSVLGKKPVVVFDHEEFLDQGYVFC